jgi:hypothetical protein
MLTLAAVTECLCEEICQKSELQVLKKLCRRGA